jgi:hypothetical protein
MQRTCPSWTPEHIPPPSQTLSGRQEQVGVVPHDAGIVVQKGGGSPHSQPFPPNGNDTQGPFGH